MNKSQVRLLSTTDAVVARDGRSYYTATFQDPENPFGKAVSRNFWQQKNAAGEPVWKGADPEQVKPFLKKLIPGYIATRKVEAYPVTGTDGVERSANIYTTVILGSELEEQVFKSLNHPLATLEVAGMEIPAPAEELAIN